MNAIHREQRGLRPGVVTAAVDRASTGRASL